MDTNSWKWFRYDEIFDIKHGFYNKKPEDNPEGDIPFIGATDSNNGVTSHSDLETIAITTKTGDGNNAPMEEKIFENCIAVTNNGSVGYAYFQAKPFTCTHDVNPLYLKGHEINPYIALFLCTLIEKERFRWAYGRKWRPIRMPSSKIKLPATLDGSPNWQYMEDFVKDHIIPQLPKKAQKVWLQKYDTSPLKQEKMKLNTQDWKWLLPSDIFTEISIAPSSDLNSLELDPFGVNYLSRAVVNNGYECKVKRDESKVTRGNFISVVMVGVPSFAFYQKNDVICSQNILVLRYPAINQYNALFLCAILQKDGYRYSYGRTLSKANFLQTKIKLPVTPSGEPDWKFMEDYIKSLPYSKNIEPSKPNEVVDELVEMKKEMIKMRQAMEAQQHKDIHYHIDQYNDNSTTYNIKK